MSEEEFSNGVYIDLTIDEEGNLMFSGGWDFEDDYDPEYTEYLKTMLDGVYAMIQTQPQNVLVAGKIFNMGAHTALSETIDFDGEEQIEFVFEPDQELIDAVEQKKASESTVVEFSKRFNPKKDRKH